MTRLKTVGIVASTDILAADQVSVDLVYALKEEDHKDLVERISCFSLIRQYVPAKVRKIKKNWILSEKSVIIKTA